MNDHVIRIGVVICTPIPYVRTPSGDLKLEDVTIDWHRHRMQLMMPTNFSYIEVQADGMEVAEARNWAVLRGMEFEPEPEYIFFLDYDVLPPADALKRLVFHAAHHKDYDIFAGVYCTKNRSLPEPLIYNQFGAGPFWDWTVGDILTTDRHNIVAVGMGCTLVRMSLFHKLEHSEEKPWFHTGLARDIGNEGMIVGERHTEDIYFCKRALTEANAKIFVDTSILCGHQDKATGVIYGLPKDSKPVKGMIWLDPEKDEEKKALDIGCGRRHRHWEGYKTYRLDIRPEVEPDFCQDAVNMNLPDNYFDLVASSHFLEHVGRWDQEKIWRNIYRICKPGGKIEHIVPSIEWAAWKIKEGEIDEDVMNVLYGAQEAHGYERIYNLHYFGYTKELAKKLAEEAGFVDVEVRDWRDDPNLYYEMIITGRKPETAENPKEPSIGRAKFVGINKKYEKEIEKIKQKKKAKKKKDNPDENSD